MRETAVLFEPIVEVRDVLESFLADRVLLAGWRQTLTTASGRFKRLGESWSDAEVVELGKRVEALAEQGLTEEDMLTKSVATDVERLLHEARVPGLPRPDDEDWSF